LSTRRRLPSPCQSIPFSSSSSPGRSSLAIPVAPDFGLCLLDFAPMVHALPLLAISLGQRWRGFCVFAPRRNHRRN
jgi:hypothetical protein